MFWDCEVWKRNIIGLKLEGKKVFIKMEYEFVHSSLIERKERNDCWVIKIYDLEACSQLEKKGKGFIISPLTLFVHLNGYLI
jgi:hypothetical protein